MSATLAFYSAVAVMVGVVLLRGWVAGRLRWYNVAVGTALWPVPVLLAIAAIVIARVLARRSDTAPRAVGSSGDSPLGGPPSCDFPPASRPISRLSVVGERE